MSKYAITAFLATALWVMPSVGTRGQGTLGDRFLHTDRDIVGNAVSGQRLLKAADAEVLAAINTL